MLSAAVKYLLNTDMKNIRADIKEYRDLSKKCSDLRKKKNKSYKLLNVKGGCPLRYLRTRTITIAIDPRENIAGSDVLEYEEKYYSICEKFFGVPCMDTNCSFHKKNNNYMALNKAYEVEKRKKEKFWEKKISRQK